MSNIIVRDIFLAFVRVHILYHATKEPVFGLEMIEELKRHGYAISPGTLYPIFHGLERTGYLRSYGEIVSGKARKYYRATPKGERALVETKKKIKELVAEVLK